MTVEPLPPRQSRTDTAADRGADRGRSSDPDGRDAGWQGTISISDGHLSVMTSDGVGAFAVSDLELLADRVQGRSALSLQGRGTLDGGVIEGTVALGPKRGGRQSVSVSLSAEAAETRLRYSGRLLHQLGGQVALRGSGAFTTSDVRAWLAAAKVFPRAVPLELNGDFAFEEGKFVSELIARSLNGTRATIGLDIPSDSSPALMSLAFQRLDLDEWIAHIRQPDAGGLPSSVAGPGATVAIGAGLVRPLLDRGIDLRVDAATVVLRAQPLRQAHLNATFLGRTIGISRAEMTLPGRTMLRVTGRPDAADRQKALDLRASLQSDNPRLLAAWLGVDTSEVAPGRLRRLALSGRITGPVDALLVDDLTLQLDETRITGALRAVLGPRPAFGIGLTGKRLELDPYLPAGLFGAGAQASPGRAAALPRQRGTEHAALSALLRRAMSEVDANLRLSFEEVSYQGVSAVGWDLDATLFRDTVTVRSFTLEDLAGITLSGAGQIGPGEGGIEWEWAWDAEANSLSGSLQALETLLPVQAGVIRASPAGPGRLSVQMFGDEAAVQGQASLRFGDAGAVLIGRIDSPWDRQERFYDGSFDIAHGPDGVFSATGTFTGTTANWQITGLQARLNETEGRGELRWQSGGQAGARNLLSGTLAFGDVPGLADMAALRRGGRLAGALGQTRDPETLQSVFSALLPQSDVALSVQIDTVGSRGAALENLSLSLLNDAQGLRFQDITADLAGGRLSGSVRQGADAMWRGEMRIRQARLEALFDRNPAFRPVGRLDADLTATGRGDVKRDWITHLNGDGLLTLTGVRAAKNDESGMASYMARLFAGEAMIRRITAPVDLHNGVLTARDAVLISDVAQGGMSLQLDLPRRRLEGRIDLEAAHGTAPLRISFSGDLSEPLARVTISDWP